MNELIQELAYQAEELADKEVDQGSEFHPAFRRIFAELIVRECASLAYDGSNGILEHFGVER